MKQRLHLYRTDDGKKCETKATGMHIMVLARKKQNFRLKLNETCPSTIIKGNDGRQNTKLKGKTQNLVA